MDFHGISDIGLVREENQDCFRVVNICEDVNLFVVCDGMGGENGGSVASKTAADDFCGRLADALSGLIVKNRIAKKHYKDFSGYMNDALIKTNETVYRLSLTEMSLCGMGTTLVGALIADKTAYIINIGDSRLYFISPDEIIQVTKDHSYVQYLLDTGKITTEEARFHPRKNLITRSVGTSDGIAPDLYELSLAAGESLLLCSDGLSNTVTDSEIFRCINDGSLKSSEEKVARLVTLAKDAGGFDNITALLVNYD